MTTLSNVTRPRRRTPSQSNLHSIVLNNQEIVIVSKPRALPQSVDRFSGLRIRNRCTSVRLVGGPVNSEPGSEFIMVIRLTSAAATIIVLMSVAPMAQSAPGKVGHSARFISTMPADVTTVKDGRITAAMVGVGGFLGIDEKTVVVPFDAFTVSKENNQRRLTLNSTKDALKSAPGFTYDRATAAWVTDKSVSTAAQKLPLGIGTQPRE